MPVHRTNVSRMTSSSISNNTIRKVAGVNSRFFPNVASNQESPYDGDQDTMPHETGSDYLACKGPFLSENSVIYYPVTAEERRMHRTKDGRKLTPHQWTVYDFARTIPMGKVTTYKEVASVIGGSPRSVGNALRNNPFSPYVPCHRVIASSLFIGGFFGEWGKNHKTGLRYNDKVAILSEEGVEFDDKGNLLGADKALWRP